jgi:hypothetical protein
VETARLKAALLAAEAAPAAFRPLRLVVRAAASVVAAIVVAAVAGEVVGSIAVASGVSASTEIIAPSARRRPAEVSAWPGRTRAVFRDIEAQCTAPDLAPVELLDCLLGMFFSAKADEGETPGTACFAVFWNMNVHHLANFTKELTKLLVRRGKVEVPYEYLV